MSHLLGRLRKEEAGLTLVEILVVIAILAILTAVVVPNFTGLIGSGKAQARLAELRTLQTIVDSYMADTRVTAITATTITPGNYNTGIFASYFRQSPACNHTVATTGLVTQDAIATQPTTC